MIEWIIRGLGIATLGFAVFHALLPGIMGWKTDLESLSIGNRKTVRALNIGITYLLIVMGLVCVLAAPSLLTSVLGRGILLGILGFWALRTVIQVVVYGYEWKPSYAMTALFIVMTLAYGFALVVQ